MQCVALMMCVHGTPQHCPELQPVPFGRAAHDAKWLGERLLSRLGPALKLAWLSMSMMRFGRRGHRGPLRRQALSVHVAFERRWVHQHLDERRMLALQMSIGLNISFGFSNIF